MLVLTLPILRDGVTLPALSALVGKIAGFYLDGELKIRLKAVAAGVKELKVLVLPLEACPVSAAWVSGRWLTSKPA